MQKKDTGESGRSIRLSYHSCSARSCSDSSLFFFLERLLFQAEAFEEETLLKLFSPPTECPRRTQISGSTDSIQASVNRFATELGQEAEQLLNRIGERRVALENPIFFEISDDCRPVLTVIDEQEKTINALLADCKKCNR